MDRCERYRSQQGSDEPVVAFLQLGLEQPGPRHVFPEVDDDEVDEQKHQLAGEEGGDIDRAELVAHEQGKTTVRAGSPSRTVSHQPGLTRQRKARRKRLRTPTRPLVAQVTNSAAGKSDSTTAPPVSSSGAICNAAASPPPGITP